MFFMKMKALSIDAINTQIFSQSYTFIPCEMENFNFLCLIWDNYLPKAPTKNNRPPLTPVATPRGYPPFKTSTKNQYQKNTLAPIAILLKFTYMLKNNI